MNHTDFDHGLAGIGATFVILAQTPRSAQPCEGPFDYPTSMQNHESFLVRGTAHNLQFIFHVFLYPGIQRMIVILVVRPDFPQARKSFRLHAVANTSGAAAASSTAALVTT